MLEEKQKELLLLEAHRAILKKDIDDKKEEYSKVYAKYLALYREVKILQTPTKSVSKKDREIQSYLEDSDCVGNMIQYVFDAIVATSEKIKGRPRFADKEIVVKHINDLKSIMIEIVSDRLKISVIRNMSQYQGGLNASNISYSLFVILSHPIWVKRLYDIS